MQSHDKNNKCNHICFVTCSNIHTIPMNTWQRCRYEEQETQFSVAAGNSFRTSEFNIFLYQFIDIFCLHFLFNVTVFGTCRVQENYACISFSDFPKCFFAMC